MKIRCSALAHSIKLRHKLSVIDVRVIIIPYNLVVGGDALAFTARFSGTQASQLETGSAVNDLFSPWSPPLEFTCKILKNVIFSIFKT